MLCGGVYLGEKPSMLYLTKVECWKYGKKGNSEKNVEKAMVTEKDGNGRLFWVARRLRPVECVGRGAGAYSTGLS